MKSALPRLPNRAWIRRDIFFHGKRHPAEMGAPEITRFRTSLAVESKVAASTRNQALSALLFLYREVLLQQVPWLDDLVNAKRPQHLPVVLTREEVRAVLGEIHGVPRLMAFLLYGAGLRSMGNSIYFASVNYALRFQESATCLVAPSGQCQAYLPSGQEGVLVQAIKVEEATGLLAARYARERHRESGSERARATASNGRRLASQVVVPSSRGSASPSIRPKTTISGLVWR